MRAPPEPGSARAAPLRHPVQPRLGAELLGDELLGGRILLRGDVTRRRAVQVRERGFHLVDDLGAGEPGLAAERVDALGRARDALVADLLAPDAEHLGHLLAVHVVAHRDVVQHRPRPESFLCGAADLAVRARDVVERLVERVDTERLQRDDHPLVEEGVAVGEAHPLHQVGRARRSSR